MVLSFPCAFAFAIGPRIRPRNMRRGRLSPSAHSMAAAQCATACAGLILPNAVRCPAAAA
jgi:hypothetical protein